MEETARNCWARESLSIILTTLLAIRCLLQRHQHHDRCTITTELVNLVVEKNKLS